MFVKCSKFNKPSLYYCKVINKLCWYWTRVLYVVSIILNESCRAEDKPYLIAWLANMWLQIKIFELVVYNFYLFEAASSCLRFYWTKFGIRALIWAKSVSGSNKKTCRILCIVYCIEYCILHWVLGISLSIEYWALY